jgi:hypothetical protein
MEGRTMSDVPEMTKDDIRNGWTAEEFEAYHAERSRAQSGVVMFDPDYRRKPRPTAATGGYRPLRAFR